ncbi:MAG: hypothetical protein KDJ26_01235 [Alphaproteobacteria bacterium]|jgi:hypothetical protein|nr:hypothetical protein [Alphaproteobacteria bacterium]MCB1550602.1 hypothetical protein [Alphaproteobacteria bacterium]MCB9985467.1 hypothetical protein [Micavibrio sp.]HPQ50353.1 hypothetical protein [Alphaproteobacteria bacterium]HRK98713.1 hypothetical protein [Alphaproteobacteria bacterium]
MFENHHKALVVFSDETDLWWLKFLRRGFRHCFVVIQIHDRWVVIDPMLHFWEVSIPDVSIDFDLARWFREKGMRVVETCILSPSRRCYPPIFLSCVEVVKRVVGIHKPWIKTPLQLYRFLKIS